MHRFAVHRPLRFVVAATSLAGLACTETDLPTTPPPSDSFVATASSTVWIPDDVWDVMQTSCAWCHTPEHPLAGVDLSQRLQPVEVMPLMGTGVQLEMAPLVNRLPEVDKQRILDWVEGVTGPLPPVSIPATVHWELDDVLAGLPEGAPVPGFGAVVEDGFIDTTGWTVRTYTDRFGITFRSVALDQTHAVDPAVFPLSVNPSSYFVPKGVPWHGRFYDCRLEGDVRVDRWISVALLARDLTPPGRDGRDYVRLQFDRDAISLRSVPTAFETYPWGGTAAQPGPDARLTGTLDAFGFYQRNDEWLHFVFTAMRVPGGVELDAQVTRRGTGETVASLHAFMASSEPLSGMFFLHAYAVGGKRNWANLVFDARIDGDGTGGTAPPPAGHAAPRPAVRVAPVP